MKILHFLLLIIIVSFATRNAVAQISISPGIIEFGNAGYDTLSWNTGPDRRTFTVTNTSASDPLTLDSISAELYSGVNLMYLRQTTASRHLNPGESSRFCIEYVSRGPGETVCPVYISYSYPGFKQPHDTTIFGHARSIHKQEPFMTHMDFPDMRECNCPLNRTPDIWFDYLKIINPGPDTLTLDSLIVVTETPGIHIDRSPAAFDEVPTNNNDGTGFHPPRRIAPAPRLLLPRLPMTIKFTIYHYPFGERIAIVRAHISKKDGSHFILQDTARVRVQQSPIIVYAGASPSGLNSVRFNDSIQLGLSIGTCSVPGNVPVTIEHVGFKGPRAAQLKLFDTGGAAVPIRPFILPPCDLGLQTKGGLLWFHGSLPAGITSDTAVVIFSYTDSLGTLVRDSAIGVYTLEVTAPLSAPFRPTHTSGSLRAIPNPATSSVSLHWSTDELYRTASVRLYDQLGRDLGISIPMNDSGTARIDVSTLPPGTYTAIVRAPNGIHAATSIVVMR